MAFDQSFLDELTARCDIVDIVSRYVQLKRSGANYFGLCPFHNEKSGSFSVSPDKQIFYCFGCHAGGGVISFIMRAEGLEFPDAVAFLAKQINLPIPEDRRDPYAGRRRERLLNLMRDAARFYYAELWKPENAKVQQYFAKRGLRRKTMNNFGLGFAPDSFFATMDAMQTKGYTKEELLDCGLVARSEKGNLYDKFRNRVMFPIIDQRGNVIAFGGRVMDDSKPKYLNSPETTIFHKGRNLFALNLARKTKSDYFILAEGYMDVIALHQAGFDSAVASLGTALTDEQARMIARHTKNIVISYDADGAGQAASQRAIDILKKADLSVKVLKMPGAKDPDEFIREKGPDAFRRLIEHSENHNAYRLEAIAAKFDLEEDEQRVEFLREAARMLAAIDGAVEREVYAGRAAQMAGVSKDAMEVEVKRALAIRRKQQRTAQHREIRAPAQAAQPKDRTLHYPDIVSARAEEGILALIFNDSTLLSYLADKITPQDFTAPVLRKLFAHAQNLYNAGRPVTIGAFEGYLEQNELSLLARIADMPVPAQRERAIDDYIQKIREQALRQRAPQQTLSGEDPLLAKAKLKAKK